MLKYPWPTVYFIACSLSPLLPVYRFFFALPSSSAAFPLGTVRMFDQRVRSGGTRTLASPESSWALPEAGVSNRCTMKSIIRHTLCLTDNLVRLACTRSTMSETVSYPSHIRLHIPLASPLVSGTACLTAPATSSMISSAHRSYNI
jgi:hypothetical protein